MVAPGEGQPQLPNPAEMVGRAMQAARREMIATHVLSGLLAGMPEDCVVLDLKHAEQDAARMTKLSLVYADALIAELDRDRRAQLAELEPQPEETDDDQA